ncbi:toll-like receptor 2 [Hetaerina americana]|uniref:toll-like receptor 2 n=1 Tax=Hetaerina americana TaxID=62018 RepID=UPI003A7F3F83
MREASGSPRLAAFFSAKGSPGERPRPREYASEGAPWRESLEVVAAIRTARRLSAITTAASPAAFLPLLLLFLSPRPCDAVHGIDEVERPCPTKISSGFHREWVTKEGRLSRFERFDVQWDAGLASVEPQQDAFPCLFCNSTAMGVCSGERMTALPDVKSYPKGMRYLKVMGSGIEAIPAKAFQGLRLEHIEIHDNENLCGNLDDDAFEDVLGLQKLNITRSGLKMINFKWFRGLNDLKVLSLDDNCICFGCDNNGSAEDSSLSDCTSSAGWMDEGKHDFGTSEYTEHLVPNLVQLSLAKNKLTHLSKHYFEWLRHSKLKSLNLRGTYISTVENGSLLAVSKTLLELDISDSMLDDELLLIPLLSSFSGNESSLQVLGLAYLGLNHLPFATLKLVNHSLHFLTLYGNNFHIINKYSFPPMNRLQELDLRHCNIKSIETASFQNLPNIRTLLLSNNRITKVAGIFTGLQSLQQLDFSHNLGAISSEGVINEQKNNIKENLRIHPEEFSEPIFPPSLLSLDMSYTEIQDIGKLTFKGLSNLQSLSICYSKLSNIFNKSQPFKDLKQLKTLDMSGNPWLETKFSSWIFNGLNSLQSLYLDSISNGRKYGYDFKLFSTPNSDSPFHDLLDLRLLSMEHNYIHTINESIFLPLIKLEVLYLSNNHLISWDLPLFHSNKNLQKLTLHQNQISYISDSMLEDFRNLSVISLYGNPILCHCNVWKFALLAKSGKINVVDWKELNSYMCIDRSKNKYETFDGDWSSECEKQADVTDELHGNSTLYSPISVSSWGNSMIYIAIIIVITISLVVIMAQRKWKHFQLLIKNVDVLGLMNGGKSTVANAYNYDVFVSYSDHDRQWVLNKLLPKLEMKNDIGDDSKQCGPAFKVCLHERDFQVGSSILENIMSCMDNSRMILLVVSSTFIRSQWCQFEMDLAQHRLLETRRDDLLLVLLEEIPRDKRPKTLHYLMATKTYLVWNEEMNDLFWKRLRHAIKSNPSEKEKSISSFP